MYSVAFAGFASPFTTVTQIEVSYRCTGFYLLNAHLAQEAPPAMRLPALGAPLTNAVSNEDMVGGVWWCASKVPEAPKFVAGVPTRHVYKILNNTRS